MWLHPKQEVEQFEQIDNAIAAQFTRSRVVAAGEKFDIAPVDRVAAEYLKGRVRKRPQRRRRR